MLEVTIKTFLICRNSRVLWWEDRKERIHAEFECVQEEIYTGNDCSIFTGPICTSCSCLIGYSFVVRVSFFRSSIWGSFGWAIELKLVVWTSQVEQCILVHFLHQHTHIHYYSHMGQFLANRISRFLVRFFNSQKWFSVRLNY